MKRLGSIFLLVLVAPTLLWAGSKKLTVGQLQDFLTGLHNAHKNDEQIADQMEQIELTEELTISAMNRMAGLINGPLSTEQMYVLEARSAMLAPPDTDLPKDPPLGGAAQRALLAKAQDYAATIYPQLPRLTAARLVARFQDGAKTIASDSSFGSKMTNADDPLGEKFNYFTRIVNVRKDKVDIDNGIQKPAGRDTTPWGRNGLVNSMLPFLPLNLLTSEAVSTGDPKFLRWETIEGHRTAVFAFAVNKKKSDYAINYCCFPETSSMGDTLYGGRGPAGGASGEPSGQGAFLGGLSASAFAQPDSITIGYVADWNPFKGKSGYHGELFLDPDTGVIIRTIVEAGFKHSAFVHYEDIRVDYTPIRVGRNILGVPVRSFTIAEIVPNGASFVGQHGVRHQYVTQSYKDFHAMDGAFQLAALVTQGGRTTASHGAIAESLGGKSAFSGPSAAHSEDEDEPPPGGFPAIESIARPSGPLDISASGKAIQRPPDEEIQALLAKAAQNAGVYWDSLPNFTCRKVTNRFAGSSSGTKWEPIDTITGRLDYFEHQEEWQFEEYQKGHEKSRNPNADPGTGMSDFGIFGDVIRGLFRPAAKPEISWFENDVLGNQSVQVFKYSVAKENSNLALRVSAQELVDVGYHGMVYIDSATGEVRRITQIADDVPKHFPIYQTLISTDYDHVTIGGQQYLLPIQAQIVLRRTHKGRLELNQIRYSDFHRYRSTARILNSSPVPR